MPPWLAPLLSLLTTAAVLGWLLGPGRSRQPLDQPNERSLHQHATPRSGGIAVMAGVLGAGALVVPGSSVLLASACGLALVSLVDDWRGLPIVLRFGAHALAATVFVVAVLPPLPWFALAATAFLIAWSINLYNFMDGSDGLAGGMTVFGFGTFAAALALGGDGGGAWFCLSICAAALAFLRVNFHPARVFLGDAGSIPLGFLAGALGAAGWAAGHWPLWFPFVVFAPFFVDATVTLLRRILRGERFWRAHREHYYQRLVQLGWGHRRTALAEYAVMGASALTALVALELSTTGRLALLAAWALTLVALMLAVDRAWADADRVAGRTSGDSPADPGAGTK
jgi:UDP-N-acetylmuramyl pentapeptide phosphotransferase/UDP-N-acetylglucosamine-1-phosphate transferase